MSDMQNIVITYSFHQRRVIPSTFYDSVSIYSHVFSAACPLCFSLTPFIHIHFQSFPCYCTINAIFSLSVFGSEDETKTEANYHWTDFKFLQIRGICRGLAERWRWFCVKSVSSASQSPTSHNPLTISESLIPPHQVSDHLFYLDGIISQFVQDKRFIREAAFWCCCCDFPATLSAEVVVRSTRSENYLFLSVASVL